MIEFLSKSPAETESFAADFAKKITPPAQIFLKGDLGAGKTAFTRGFAKGVGYEGRVSSPTFTVMNMYEGTPNLYHYDFYRVQSEEELEELGVYEYLYKDISLIEWPDKVEELFPDAICVKIERGEAEEERKITIEGMNL